MSASDSTKAPNDGGEADGGMLDRIDAAEARPLVCACTADETCLNCRLDYLEGF